MIGIMPSQTQPTSQLLIVAIAMLIGLTAVTLGVGLVASQDTPPAEAAYYGNVTIAETGEPPEEPIIVQGAIEGNVSDKIEVGTELPYNLGGPDADDPKLVVSPPENETAMTEFIVADEVVETVEFEGFINNVDITVPEDVVKPSFSVAVTDTPDRAGTGSEINLGVTVSNTGAYSGSQTITAAVDGEEQATETVSLDGGQTTNISLTVPVEQDASGSLDLTVSSTDDEETVSVDVVDATFTVDITNTNVDRSITQGEELIVTAAIEETNAVRGTQTVRLQDFNGTTVDSTELTLDANESQTVDLRWTPVGTDIGTGDITVASEDTNDSIPLTVESGDQPPAPPAPPSDGGTPPDDSGTLPSIEQVLDLPATPAPVFEEVQRITSVDETTDDSSSAVVRFSDQSPVQQIFWQQIRSDVVDSVAAVAAFNTTPVETEPLPGTGLARAQVGFNNTVAERTTATVNMQINRDRLADAGITDLNELEIFRYNETTSQWSPSETFVIDQTDTAVTLATEVPGFSFIGIAAVTAPEIDITTTPETPVSGENVTLSSSVSPATTEIVDYSWEINGNEFDGENVTVTAPDNELTATLIVETTAGATAQITRQFETQVGFRPALNVSVPEIVQSGIEETVTLSLTNTGERDGQDTLTLDLNNQTVFTDTVTLAPDETVEQSVNISIPANSSSLQVEAQFGAISEAFSVAVTLSDQAQSELTELEQRVMEFESDTADLEAALADRNASELSADLTAINQNISQFEEQLGSVDTQQDLADAQATAAQIADRIDRLQDEVSALGGQQDDETPSTEQQGDDGLPILWIGAGLIVVLIAGAGARYLLLSSN